jgi:hypothetical protein
LHRGYWDAKVADDLDAEIGKRSTKGYSLNKVIATSSSRARGRQSCSKANASCCSLTPA